MLIRGRLSVTRHTTQCDEGKYVLTRHIEVLTNDAMSPMFQAVIEATEAAVYNSMFRAITTTAHGHTVEALPIEKTTAIMRKYGVIK